MNIDKCKEAAMHSQGRTVPAERLLEYPYVVVAGEAYTITRFKTGLEASRFQDQLAQGPHACESQSLHFALVACPNGWVKPR